MTIAAILKHKGHAVTTIDPNATIAEATHTLAEHHIGAAVVCNEHGDLLGILSERDIVRALAHHGATVLDQHVNQLMTHQVTTAAPRTTVAEAMEMMTCGRFRHLPVMNDGKMIGLVSIGDVVKARISQQETEVDSLKAYVAGVR
jgi:CBS domain-containing protein